MKMCLLNITFITFLTRGFAACLAIAGPGAKALAHNGPSLVEIISEADLI